MLPTQSSGAGRFAELDLSRLPSPCFVIDEIKLTENLQMLSSVKLDFKIFNRIYINLSTKNIFV